MRRRKLSQNRIGELKILKRNIRIILCFLPNLGRFLPRCLFLQS